MRRRGHSCGILGSPVARALDYPTHPVIIVVPFAPGGSADIVARLLAQVLEQRLGKSFVVENRPGAGTIIAAGAVAKAEPDGYQLLMARARRWRSTSPCTRSCHTIRRSTSSRSRARSGAVRVARQSVLPVHSLMELIAYAKARPGQLSFASVGPGVPHHLYAELLMNTAGIAMTYVPYKGSAPALNESSRDTSR